MQKKTHQKRLDGKLWISNVINCSKHKVFIIIPLSRSMIMVLGKAASKWYYTFTTSNLAAIWKLFLCERTYINRNKINYIYYLRVKRARGGRAEPITRNRKEFIDYFTNMNLQSYCWSGFAVQLYIALPCKMRRSSEKLCGGSSCIRDLIPHNPEISEFAAFFTISRTKFSCIHCNANLLWIFMNSPPGGKALYIINWFMWF